MAKRSPNTNDLTGMRFGRLIAVEPTDGRVGTMVVWRCACDCGNVAYAASSNLTRGRVRSCGCLAREVRSSDLVGQRFGKLKVVAREGTDATGAALWRCECDCGNEVVASTRALKAGKKSCGCGKRGNGKDLAGQRFGKLTAMCPVGRRNRYVVWECVCDCGNVREVLSRDLTSGNAVDCGRKCALRNKALEGGKDA
ncbi:MAG: hypothetical protein IJ087_08535 [Eggerthellaceae bacterium]|nr:hypothetical protein [Eggerthellaceae bacterium]